MLEVIFANISTLDIVIAAFVLVCTWLWRRGMPDVHIDVHNKSRMFTVIQNKWQSSFGNAHVFKPSWFITIEAKHYKKTNWNGSEYWVIDGQMVSVNEFRDLKHKEYPLGMESADEQIDFGDYIVGADGQSLDDFIEESMYNIGTPGSDPYEDQYKVFNDSYKACYDAMHKRRTISAQTRANAKAPPPIKKYTVYFHIPFMVRWQFNRLMARFMRVNLKNEDKDELLQKLYWDYEERRLAGLGGLGGLAN